MQPRKLQIKIPVISLLKKSQRLLTQLQPRIVAGKRTWASQRSLDHLPNIIAIRRALASRNNPIASVNNKDNETNTTTTATPEMASSTGLTTILTKDATPPAGPYSQGIAAAGQIWVAGQIPADTEGNLIEGSVAEKTAQCCKNIKAVLESAGSSVDKVVRVGVFLTDMKNFAEMNGEYEKWFSHKPARTCVAVYQLPKGVPVEIEAIALQ